MRIGLIICTYKRPAAVHTLLQSITLQVLLPTQILVVDASEDLLTSHVVAAYEHALPVRYVKAGEQHRGLTRQRNLGVSLLSADIDIVSFLDDDVELEAKYFSAVQASFLKQPGAVGVEGIDILSNAYSPMIPGRQYNSYKFYCFDEWVRPEPLRYQLRKRLGLMSALPPSFVPPEGNARNGLPPSGKTYEVQSLMGCLMSVRKEVFYSTGFSTFFEGYGLYEDADFSVSLCRLGKLYCCTQARARHYHAPAGRPNHYQYGRMVLRNGWYVWKRRYPVNSGNAIMKWHLVSLLQIIMLLKGAGRSGVLPEFAGRFSGYFSLFFNPPTIVEPTPLLSNH